MGYLKSRRGWMLGSAAVLAAIVSFAVLPALGGPDPDADHLRMTDADGDLFFYGGPDPATATDTQAIDTKKGCVINPTSGELVALDGGPGGVKPGIFDHGMGGKSGGSNGTPCSEVEGNEKLTIRSTNASWFKLRFDVEAKGGAWIIVDLRDSNEDLVQRHQLLTGSAIEEWNSANPDDMKTPSMDLPDNPYQAGTKTDDPNTPLINEQVEACADPTDSGPDANVKDNCLWTIDAGQVFTTVEIYIKDGNGGSVSLEGGNDYASEFPGIEYDSLFFRAGPPTAVDDDQYEVDEDTLLSVNAANGVLANDSDPLGQTLMAVLDSDVSNGTLSLNADGSFTYTPDLNYNGTDSFTYVATAGGENSEPATVTITINPVNDDPEAIDGPLDATEDTTGTYPPEDLATDPDGDDITIDSAEATEGQVDINEDGELEYTPPADFCGTDVIEITFTVSDGNGGFDTATVDVNVACQADDDSYDMDERIQQGGGAVLNTLVVAAPGVLGNDTNDPSSINPTVKTDPATGSVTLSPNGSFSYTPGVRTWVGNETSYTDTWEYEYTEAGDTQSAFVTITIFRNLCQEDTVSDSDGNVFGSFTLISSDGCKNWVAVEANGGDDTVLFQPDSPDTTGIYEGTLTISNLVIEDGALATVILRYDPTGGDNYQPVPSCVGTEANPALPGPAPGWCFYDFEPTLTGTNTSGEPEWIMSWSVYGEDDPKFSFR